MKHYQISKYCGDFDDWSAITDIGNEFNGVVLTRDEYLRIEDLHVKFVENFVQFIGGKLTVAFIYDARDRFQNDPDLLSLGTIDIKLGDQLYIDKIQLVSRLCLREFMGVRLESTCGAYLTFGYDFCIRVGVPEFKGQIPTLNGLYVREVYFDPSE